MLWYASAHCVLHLIFLSVGLPTSRQAGAELDWENVGNGKCSILSQILEWGNILSQILELGNILSQILEGGNILSHMLERGNILSQMLEWGNILSHIFRKGKYSILSQICPTRTPGSGVS